MTGHNGRHDWKRLSVATDTARTLYAGFPPTLKAAMKVAAERNGWCKTTWASQTEALADAMTRGWTADELADAYRNPPPCSP